MNLSNWEIARSEVHATEAGRRLSEPATKGGLLPPAPHVGAVLAVVDIDDFVVVDAALGRPESDMVLEHVESWLRDRFPHAAVHRAGGDEFVVRHDIAEAGQTQAFVQRLQDARIPPVAVGGLTLEPTFCAGVSFALSLAAAGEPQLNEAYLALRKAKRHGARNVQLCCTETKQESRRRVQLGAALRQALRQRALDVHYQPILRCKDGAMVGAEALVRWNDVERGPISPAEFVPYAETSGLIHRLGEQVLEAAAIAASRLREHAGGNFRVAVNVSPKQLQRLGFARRVTRALDHTGCPPELLRFEVMETALLDRSKTLIGNVKALHRMGIEFAIDDFGSGYASLQALLALPITTLKIDRKFVSGMIADSRCAAVVQRTLQLAADLGIETVAEGVETSDQRALLSAYNCNEFQGYLVSAALPLESLLDLMDATGPRTSAHLRGLHRARHRHSGEHQPSCSP